MIEYDNQINAERIERERQRDEKSPICSNTLQFDEDGNILKNEKECGTKTLYENKCGGYVCPECNTHYSTMGGRMNYCWCGWNKQNFDPSYAGERWDSDY